MNESQLKTKMVKKIKEEGGYARRLEDQFAVGIPDVIAILPNLPVIFIEAKIIRGQHFSASPRQALEIERLNTPSPSHAMAMLLGFKEGEIYVAPKGYTSADVDQCLPKGQLTFLQLFSDWVRHG